MVQITVEYPVCGIEEIVKFGKVKSNMQRYQCKNAVCSCNTFILDYHYNGCKQETKSKIFQMSMNGSGVLDTFRVLGISVI